MANRFPLVFDAGAAKSIQELPTGDNLNLSGSSIANAVNISATGTLTVPTLNVNNINVAGSAIAAVAVTNDYNDLTNRPSLFSGDYNDLTNKPIDGLVSWNDVTDKPVIATKISQLANDTNFVSNAQINITSNQVTDLSTVATSGSFTDLSNVPNFVTNEQIVGGTLTVEVSNTGDLQGSVFADDSSLMVDHINNELLALKLKTDVIEANDFSVLAPDGFYFKTNQFFTLQTQSFEIYNDNSGTNISDLDVIRFQGNVDFSQASLSGLDLGSVIGDFKGSVFADDSSIIVDSVNNTVSANIINGNIINGTTINGNLNKVSNVLTISSQAGINMLPAGPLNIPNATSVTIAGTAGISLTATDNLSLSSTSGIIDFVEGSTVDFTGTSVTGLNVTGDIVGSVFADDSSTLVDAINRTFYGDGISVSNGSSLLVDATNAKLLSSNSKGISITALQTTVDAQNDVIINSPGITYINTEVTSGNINIGNGTNNVNFAIGTIVDATNITIDFSESTVTLPYTPAVSANWAAQPTTVAQALDMIAASIAANHGPV